MSLTHPHILMTADALGGLWTYALDLGGALRRRGFRVTLAILGPGLDREKSEAAEQAEVALFHAGHHRPDWLAEGPAEVAAAGRLLAAMARAQKADLVHLNHPAFAAETSFRQPVVAACHSCLATWWRTVRDGPLPEDFVWRAELNGKGLFAAARVMAPTEAFANATREAYGLPQAPRVVPNGRAQAPGSAEPEGEPADAVFTAGRLWDDGKNIATLDAAAATLDVPVRAAGPTVGPNGARLGLAHARELGPLSAEAVRAELGRRPIYVAPALYEPFGLAVLEAAQAGCALVLSDIPTFREVWNGAALFFPARDAAALADAVLRLRANAGERARLAAAARERAAAFSLDAMAERVVAVYAEVLRGAEARGAGRRGTGAPGAAA